MTDEFIVAQGEFEGPLELLLNLIEKKKLSINRISLAEVTDAYIRHVRALDNMPLQQTAHFVLIASTLLLAKSLSLLPSLALSEEEEQSIQELETRLALFQAYKGVERHVVELFGAQGERKIYKGARRLGGDTVFAPHPSLTAERFAASVRTLIQSFPAEELPEATVERVVSLEEMIDDLRERLQAGLETTFSEFAGYRDGYHSREERLNVIIGFLAILELVKEEIIYAVQEKHARDIRIKKIAV